MTFLTERLKFGRCHRINQVVHRRDQPAVRPLIEDEPLIERMLNVLLNHDVNHDGAPPGDHIHRSARAAPIPRIRLLHTVRLTIDTP